MKVDRESLLAALRAASLIVDPNHSIDIFQKVWLLEDHVLGFNANGMVVIMPCEVPNVGGIEGKLLLQLLERIEVEEVDMIIDHQGQLVVVGDNVTLNLAVLEETETVHAVSDVPELNEAKLTELDVATLFDKVNLKGMLQLNPVQHESLAEFQSLMIDVKDNGRAKLYASDRYSVNHCTLKLEGAPGKYLVPFEFMHTFMYVSNLFIEDGTFAFDDSIVMVTNEAGAGLFARLLSPTGVDFDTVLSRIWPNGVADPKKLADIPDELKNIITQAKLVSKDLEDVVRLSVTDGVLKVVTASKGKTKFTAELEWDHPNCQINVRCSKLLQALPHATRMIILPNAIAFRGPNKFWRFIASKA